MLPIDHQKASLIGRVWRADKAGPSVVTVRQNQLIDITSPHGATVSDILKKADAAEYVRQAEGEKLGDLEEWKNRSQLAAGRPAYDHLLSPNDLQAVKACGVTFAKSMVERVIEEKADGDPAKAHHIRQKCVEVIGDSLAQIEAGSQAATQVKSLLIQEGLWSQYLEVGIGPDAEVFTKAQPLSAVGCYAPVGLHPISTWNNPEPEIVLAVDHAATIKGACLGNDVNLRDVEGRSALLLGKAKDNNASAAIGPFIRLLDDDFTLDDIRNANLRLTVKGEDGFVLEGGSSMQEISRDITDLVAQTSGAHHQYPDGFMLYLGTMFAPIQDRDNEGEGFTHKINDEVQISAEKLGCLSNVVRYSTQCAPWEFGLSALMSNLSQRGLLR